MTKWPCRRSLLVQSHGIPEEVIDNAVKAAKSYFSLPEATKMEVSVRLIPFKLPT